MEYSIFVEKIRNIVEEACRKDTNIFGYEIWSYHIVDVVKHSQMLAERLGADTQVVELAALLHDYAGIKDSSLQEAHHIYGAEEAERILKSFNYPADKIEKVKQCILLHRGSIKAERLTPESVCIASADAMAHITQIPSLLHLVYFKRGMAVDDGVKWVKDKIERSWNKLCLEAREIVEDYYNSAKKIL